MHKCKAVAKIAGEWVLDVLHNTVKHIGHLDQASKEILNISKKVETSNDGYEKERNNWSKIVMGWRTCRSSVYKSFRLNVL